MPQHASCISSMQTRCPLSNELVRDSVAANSSMAVDNVVRSKADVQQLLCAGAPAAMRSAPTEMANSDELQSEAMAVPLRGEGGAATPVTDVDFLFSQNKNKLKALQVMLQGSVVSLKTRFVLYNAVESVCSCDVHSHTWAVMFTCYSQPEQLHGQALLFACTLKALIEVVNYSNSVTGNLRIPTMPRIVCL